MGTNSGCVAEKTKLAKKWCLCCARDPVGVKEVNLFRSLSGRNGDTIREMCRVSQCKINVPQRREAVKRDASATQTIMLKGTPTAVDTAKVPVTHWRETLDLSCRNPFLKLQFA